MSRSLKKGPYVDPRVLKKVLVQKSSGKRTPIKTWSRACVITPDMVGATFLVHNGKDFLNVLIEENLVATVNKKAALFLSLLHHKKINAVRGAGLMIAVEFNDYESNKKIIDALIEDGIFTDWFLFASNCLRIAPPLTITEDEIKTATNKLIAVLNKI